CVVKRLSYTFADSFSRGFREISRQKKGQLSSFLTGNRSQHQNRAGACQNLKAGGGPPTLDKRGGSGVSGIDRHLPYPAFRKGGERHRMAFPVGVYQKIHRVLPAGFFFLTGKEDA